MIEYIYCRKSGINYPKKSLKRMQEQATTVYLHNQGRGAAIAPLNSL